MIAELRERIARLEGEAEGNWRAAAAEVAAKEELIAELRRPWWRRLIG